MNNNNTIPVIIGVTGHRSIRAEDRRAIYDSVRSELKKIQKLCSSSRILMLNSLAEGGDQLCADAAEELGIDLVAILPMERGQYEKDFSGSGL